MIEFQTILILMIIGFASLFFTLLLCLTEKRGNNVKKYKQQIFEVKIFNFKFKLFPFVYLTMILVLFFIGVFSNFLFYSIFGLAVASIPLITYLLIDNRFRKKGEKQ